MSACKSVPLIRPVKAPEPQFVVVQEGIDFLRGLEGPLYVVSVVGAMRQGKSFILGLLAGGPGIFRLGHQTRSCTEGVDVFARPHPSGRGRLVFLDVEGQGSTDRNDTYDAALTTVAMLLSSMVVYNCLSARCLNDFLAHAAAEAHRDNEEVARSFCRDLLHALYAPVESSVEGKRYICGGGYSQYMQDAEGVQHEYAECCQDTLVPEHVATEIGEEFWRSTENIRKILRDSDKQLSEAEKEKAKQEEQLVQLELRRKQEWEENKAQLQRQEAENQERMRTWEQAMGSMRDQMRVQQEDMQRASEQREAQLAEFIQQGQVEAREQMQDIMRMASEQSMAQQEHMSSLLTSMQDSQRTQQESMNGVMISLRDLANRPPPKIEVQRSCAVQ
ncbi:Interferon-induced guanylate-binding protein 2 [Symbiodinium microadriaticum]|uniref:Interferon-induced guanylate-binding protein 2 n=1 Tax=Symbiodinium microadriaticum TaxID=2951 RepID=A0A1Q9DBC7_SYMMI|nr:Interferon-induced guanylate-binding protein 2 [Symbiodinium microadriaticum]